MIMINDELSNVHKTCNFYILFVSYSWLMVRTHCWQVLVGQISVWQQQAADGLWEEGQTEGQFY